MSHRQVLVLDSHAERTDIILSDPSCRDSESRHALVEIAAGVGVALAAFAERLERFRGLWLSLGVELEDEVADALVTLSNSEVDFRVGWIAVVIQCAEAALTEVEQFVVNLRMGNQSGFHGLFVLYEQLF